MNKTTMRALALIAMMTVGAVQAAAARTAGVPPDYISPGIGTLVAIWLSHLR